MKIPIAKCDLKEEEIQSVLEPLRNGWLVQGPKVAQFENSWSEFTGTKNSIAVTSCTTALYLSLAALGFKKGDEAIVPAFTWISTANVVEHLGGKVIFCDIDPETFNIDTSKLEALIGSRTKAIIPVHLFGLSADIEKIMHIAKKYSLWVIEDAACGFGSTFKDKHVGGFGNTGCFSFHPRKAITTGEGGMITTNDNDLAKKIRTLRDHGAAMTDLQRHLGPQPYLLADHPEAGFNFRMTDIQAALGFSQMQRAKQIISERKKIAYKYNNAFKDLEWLGLPAEPKHFSHSYQSYPCMFQPKTVKDIIKTKDYLGLKELNLQRNNWMDKLQSKGISTRPATHAVHMLTFYKKKYSIESKEYIFSKAANDFSVSLPLFNGLTEDEQDYIIDNVINSF